MTGKDEEPAKVAARITGPVHLLAAAGYSLAGTRRLWHEQAFRHEVIGLVVCLVILVAVGATFTEICGLIGVFLLAVAVEAFNTAIECLVDHVSPDWSVFARDAKDLGSLAVLCVLVSWGIYMAAVVTGHLLGA